MIIDTGIHETDRPVMTNNKRRRNRRFIGQRSSVLFLCHRLCRMQTVNFIFSQNLKQTRYRYRCCNGLFVG